MLVDSTSDDTESFDAKSQKSQETAETEDIEDLFIGKCFTLIFRAKKLDKLAK